MKTYSPVADLVDIDWWVGKMEADTDGEWVRLEDHLAVVAENALQIKRREVEIEKLKGFVSQFINLKYMPADATHFSLFDGRFFYKKEGDEWMVYISGAWFVSMAFKNGRLYQGDLISVEMLRA
jgi:hypothetical protein